jgi:HD-GYP domain-containing protein (c-di-GMP phosphodiesterase class II)
LTESQSSLRLAELIASLSLAIDLGVGQPMEWVMRSCLLGIRLADAMGMDEQEQQEVFYITLLRHLGCTSTSASDADLFGNELGVAEMMTADPDHMGDMLRMLVRLIGPDKHPIKRMAMMARIMTMGKGLEENHTAHCEVAQRLAATVGFSKRIQEGVYQVYERWDGQGTPKRLRGDELYLAVRVCHVAQDAATFYTVGGIEMAIQITRERAGRLFDPAVVDTFCGAAARLCAELDDSSTWGKVLAAEPGHPLYVVGDEIDSALQAVADFADFKSRYTRGHSRAVASLAASAARACGLNLSDQAAIKHAAYLHDIGKVGITAAIWSKTSALSETEMERVRMHPYLTERIFARSPHLSPLATLGALHHERTDGSGYPRGLEGATMPAAAKLLAAANTYCALLEPRPHRQACTPEDAVRFLKSEARAQRLDSACVNAVLAVEGHRFQEAQRIYPSELTAREVDVLRLIAQGLTNREVAKQLFISAKTVDNHIQNIYSKINVSTRAAATLFAMQNRLLGEVTWSDSG